MSVYKCPTCDSSNITKLALVIAKSTRTFGLGTLGLGFGGAFTSGSVGMSGNQIARQFPPPFKKSYHPILLVFTLMGAVIEHKEQQEGLMTFAFMVFLVLLVRAIWFNFKVYPKAIEQWDRLFLCNRCGSVFEVINDEPVANPEPVSRAKILKLVKGGKANEGQGKP